MKTVNFLLALFALVVAIAAVAVAFRSGSWGRMGSGNWHSWAITEESDSVILDTGFRSSNVTVCNRSYRRNSDEHNVIVRVGSGESVRDHALAHRSCVTLRTSRVEVKKPEGESISVRGYYILDDDRRRRRGSRGYWPGRRDWAGWDHADREDGQDPSVSSEEMPDPGAGADSGVAPVE